MSVTFRRPELDYPLGVEFEDAIMVGGGWTSDGGVFHNLETLQAFVERRKGGKLEYERCITCKTMPCGKLPRKSAGRKI